MNPKHRKRFTDPSSFKGIYANWLPEDLLAKLPNLDEGTPFEKELTALLRDSMGWMDIFKDAGPLLFFRGKPSPASQHCKTTGEAPDGKDIQALVEAGKLAKAKRAARQVLRGLNVRDTIAHEARSPECSGPATSALEVLALIANMQGDTEQAKKAYKVLVKQYASNAGPDANATVRYKYALAVLYADEYPEKACDLLGQVVASLERVGIAGSDLYAGAKSLAGALRMYDADPDAVDEAASYLSDAEAYQSEAYSSDPEAWWQLATTIGRQAQLSGIHGQWDEAKVHYERAAELYREHMASGGSEVILSFADLLTEYGECLLRLGEIRKAIRASKESVEVVSKNFGPLSVEMIPALMGLGNLYRDTLTPKGAKLACRVFKRVVLLHEQHFRSVEDYLRESGGLLEAHIGIIDAYIAMQSYKNGEIWAKRAIRVINDLDEGSVQLHQVYKLLAFICESDGRPEERQHYEDLATKVWESLGGASDEDNEDEAEDDDDTDDDENDQWWRGGAQGISDEE